MKIGRVQRLGGPSGRRHQHADFGKCGAGAIADIGQRFAHVLEVSAPVTGLVTRNDVVNGTNDRFGVPFSRASIPVVEADFAAKMQHQGLEGRRRVEFKPHGMQLRFGRHEVRAEAAQVLHQDERVLLLFVKPDRHEGGEVAVMAVIAQEHLGCRQCGPLRDGVPLDGLRLLGRQF